MTKVPENICKKCRVKIKLKRNVVGTSNIISDKYYKVCCANTFYDVTYDSEYGTLNIKFFLDKSDYFKHFFTPITKSDLFLLNGDNKNTKSKNQKEKSDIGLRSDEYIDMLIHIFCFTDVYIDSSLKNNEI